MISVRELGTPAPMVEFLPGASAALIESITSKAHNMKGSMTALAPGVRLGSQPGFEDPLGSVRDHIQEPGGTATVSYGSYVQDDGDVPVPIRGVAPLAGYVSQAPDYRAARNALAPAASTPLVLTSNTARQHCMVGPNALARHLQPQAIQAREGA